MKFQYLAVIFVIIMLPIVLVMSFYVQTQMDVMDRQGEYRRYLNDATYDAIKAFQINTTNSYYSSISDSKIRDIEAAVNSFYNSLTANLNYNKSDLQAYVPALVFTLYDGYYIYGKRYNVYTDTHIDPTSGELTGMKIEKREDIENNPNPNLYEYGLKPFVYYSCQYYRNSNNSFIINYTLDNFISIYGMVNGEYVNKSGYLIQINSNDSFNGKYKGVQIENVPENLKEYLMFSDSSEFIDGEYNYVVYQNQKIYYKEDIPENDENKYFWYDKGEGHSIQGETTKSAIKETIGKSSSYEYYKEAYDFSKWVYETLGQGSNAIKQTHIVTGNNGADLTFNAGDKAIFNIAESSDPTTDPENPSSMFNQHRMAVIRNAIETNLVTAINSYNSNASSFEYALPRLAEEDWEKVTNNVSMISFMQGMPIGTKYFNDYIVIPNDKNNEFVDEDALYLISNDGKYHLANCPYLVENQDKIVGGYINTAFQRQTIEKTIADDKKESHYYYRHAYSTNPVQYYSPCYQCLVNSSGVYDLENDIINNTTNNINGVGDISLLRRQYFKYLGREKNNLYKTSQ